MTVSLEPALESFLQRIPWDDYLGPCSAHFDGSTERAATFLSTLRAETSLGLRLIGEHLDGRCHVLEVGAGMGLMSTFLASQGVRITALEPGLGGFGVSTTLAELLGQEPGVAKPTRLAIPAGDLNPRDHGTFDLIFSINVIEHIPRFEEAFTAMASVLAPDGTMLHTCPNYTVPYEPHFGIPLVPLVPRWTATLQPALRTSELWQSLNFITASRIRRIARQTGLSATFRKGVIHDAFLRLESDPEFRRRQGNGLVMRVYRALTATGTLGLLRWLPATMATPLVFEARHSRAIPTNHGTKN